MYVIFPNTVHSPSKFPATPLLQSPEASSLLGVFAGSNEILLSCRADIEDEVVVELDDNPGIANRAKFSNLQKV